MDSWGFNPQTVGALATAIAALIGMAAVYSIYRQRRLTIEDRRRKHANHVRIEQLQAPVATEIEPDLCAYICNVVNLGEHVITDAELVITLRGFCDKARIDQRGLWCCEVKRNPLVSLRSYVALGYEDLLMVGNGGASNQVSVAIPIPSGLFSLVRWGVAFTDSEGVRWTRFAPKPGQSIGDLRRGRRFFNQNAKSVLSRSIGSPG